MKRSNAERLWMLGGAVGVVVLLLLGWFILISPQLSDASTLHNQKSEIVAQNRDLQTKINRLRGANMDELRSELAKARNALPSDSGLPDFTRQLADQAAASLTHVTSITAGAPSVANAVPQAATAGASKNADTDTAAPKPATVSAAGNVFAIPVSIIASGAPGNLQTLLQKIQLEGARRALVTNVTFTPNGGDPTGLAAGAQMTVQMQVFVAPKDPAAEAQLEKLAAQNK